MCRNLTRPSCVAGQEIAGPNQLPSPPCIFLRTDRALTEVQAGRAYDQLTGESNAVPHLLSEMALLHSVKCALLLAVEVGQALIGCQIWHSST